MNPVRACQISTADALLADATVVGLVAPSKNGPAVFAIGQDLPDVYPRAVLEAPQWINRGGQCGRVGDLFVTVHSWTRGADCTLTCGDLADAVDLALSAALTLTGWRVSSWECFGSRSVGDPSNGIEHRVSTFRYSVQATA